MKKDVSVFLEHILVCIDNIEEFLDNVPKESFLKNKEKQSAVIRQIEVIGEAAKNIPLPFRKKYPRIPWSDIAGMRDKLMHQYFGVDLDIVWKVCERDIPELKKKVIVIKEDIKKDGYKL